MKGFFFHNFTKFLATYLYRGPTCLSDHSDKHIHDVLTSLQQHRNERGS